MCRRLSFLSILACRRFARPPCSLRGIAAVLLFAGSLPASVALADDLGAARYTEQGELHYPDNLDRWILMGASLGSDYNETPFDPKLPGTLGVVQMEPAAYDYFLSNGHYADGTMFVLSFYATETQSQPQLQGFVQGALRLQEIHVIDRQRFAEERAFFMFPSTRAQAPAPRLEDDGDCLRCHREEARYDGTFTQFYPALRDRTAE